MVPTPPLARLRRRSSSRRGGSTAFCSSTTVSGVDASPYARAAHSTRSRSGARESRKSKNSMRAASLRIAHQWITSPPIAALLAAPASDSSRRHASFSSRSAADDLRIRRAREEVTEHVLKSQAARNQPYPSCQHRPHRGRNYPTTRISAALSSYRPSRRRPSRPSPTSRSRPSPASPSRPAACRPHPRPARPRSA